MSTTNTSSKTPDSMPVYLVCGSTCAPGAEKAVCSQCGVVVWPTRGSLAHARSSGMAAICIECYMKLDNVTFGGFMDDGNMVPKEIEDRLFAEFCRWLKKEQIQRQQAN